MVDIQPAAPEIRRGKKDRKKPQGKNITSASATQVGHNKCTDACNYTVMTDRSTYGLLVKTAVQMSHYYRLHI